MVVAIVGLGLIGGSVGLGLMQSGFAAKVLGIDSSPEALDKALRKGCIQEFATATKTQLNIDVWIVATPPLVVPEVLQMIEPCVRPGALVMDTASVKTYVVDALPSSLRGQFVGGHPMAGLAGGGVENARADLFENAAWILTPTEDTEEPVFKTALKVVYALDARPIVAEPADHDRDVAVLSHLPHAVAAILMRIAERNRIPNFGAGSWRDLTRVAASDPELWVQIFRANRVELIEALQDLIEEATDLANLIAADDAGALLARLREVRDLKLKQLGGLPREA